MVALYSSLLSLWAMDERGGKQTTDHSGQTVPSQIAVPTEGTALHLALSSSPASGLLRLGWRLLSLRFSSRKSRSYFKELRIVSHLLCERPCESRAPPQLNADEKQEAAASPIPSIPYQQSTDGRGLAVGI